MKRKSYGYVSSFASFINRVRLIWLCSASRCRDGKLPLFCNLFNQTTRNCTEILLNDLRSSMGNRGQRSYFLRHATFTRSNRVSFCWAFKSKLYFALETFWLPLSQLALASSQFPTYSLALATIAGEVRYWIHLIRFPIKNWILWNFTVDKRDEFPDSISFSTDNVIGSLLSVPSAST